MPIVVRLPAMFHARTGAEVIIEEPISDVADVTDALERRFPDLAADFADPIFNIAVNDVMLLHGVRQYPVRDGDVVEIVPTVAGGEFVTGARPLPRAHRTLRVAPRRNTKHEEREGHEKH